MVLGAGARVIVEDNPHFFAFPVKHSKRNHDINPKSSMKLKSPLPL
jgi:hypothetical protein